MKYNKNSDKPSQKRSTIIIAAIALFCIISILMVFFPSLFSYSSICSECGLIRETTEYHFPFTEIVIYKKAEYEDTTVSSILKKYNIKKCHNHNWLFEHGGGKSILGRSTASGTGMYLRNIVNKEHIGQFLEDLIQYTDPDTVKKWLNLLFTYGIGNKIEIMIHYLEFPKNGFADTNSFDRWWLIFQSEMQEYLSEINQENKEKPITSY